MDWLAILQQVFETVIVPLIGVVVVYLIKFIRAKSEEIQDSVNNDLFDKYFQMFTDTVINCVDMVSQTYVSSLKDKNAFTAEAQTEAFKKCYDMVLDVLGDEAVNFIGSMVGDFDSLLTVFIEAAVKNQKSE